MPKRKRDIEIHLYVNEDTARLTYQALSEMYPNARHGLVCYYGSKGPFIVASDVTREQFNIAADKAWQIHCETTSFENR